MWEEGDTGCLKGNVYPPRHKVSVSSSGPLPRSAIRHLAPISHLSPPLIRIHCRMTPDCKGTSCGDTVPWNAISASSKPLEPRHRTLGMPGSYQLHPIGCEIAIGCSRNLLQTPPDREWIHSTNHALSHFTASQSGV